MTTPARRRRWPRLVAAVLAFAVVARVKAQYAEAGGDRSNKAYGYVLAG